MARPKTYHVFLTKKDRDGIRAMKRRLSSDNARTRCDILLAADENHAKEPVTNEMIARKTGASIPTIVDTIRKFCTGDFAAAITPARNINSDTARLKSSGDIEAEIIAKACTSPPEGRCRWTVSLLTEACTALLEEKQITLSRATIGRTLERNDLHPHLSEYWCIPTDEDADFVAAMEEILDIYEMPYDENQPLVCMDEKPYQLLDHARDPMPMRPGDIKKIDAEYKRDGTAAIFVFINPHTGEIWQFVEETRTAVDWAEKVKYLVDEIYPGVDRIVLVMDNLNTHKLASLYKAFPPEEARRIAKKLDVHYTPTHGSWLNIAEMGIHVITVQCLGRRIPSIEALRDELNTWEEDHNAKGRSKVDWQFTTSKARTKLKRLYPDIQKFRRERDERRMSKIVNRVKGQESNDTEIDANVM